MADGTYLVTGGLSGLGLEVARWLAQRGAGRLVLIGRRDVTSEAAATWDELRAGGTTVVTKSVDVSNEFAVRALLKLIRQDGPPLRGVVHSAGVLDDAESIQAGSRSLCARLRTEGFRRLAAGPATRCDSPIGS